MARFGGIGLFGFALLALWVYCIFDVIATEESLVRALPKTMWLLIVIFVPTIGSIAWLALGRPMYAGFRPGDTRSRAPSPIRGPDDDPSWKPRTDSGPITTTGTVDPSDSEAARQRRLEEREAELERRERELERREEGEPEPGE